MTAAFLLTSLVLVATPGTGTVYTVNAGLVRGRRAAVVAAAACTLGTVPHLLAAVTGLAALLHASSTAFTVLTWAGIAYLVRLAVLTWRDPGTELAAGTSGGAGSSSTLRVLYDGVVLNLLNPKLTLFFFAFLPQFVAPGAGATTAVAALGGVFMALTLVVFTGYGLAATSLRPLLLRRPELPGRANKAFAVTYVLIALALVAAQLPH